VRVFYSYCHTDEIHRNTLEKYLTTLRKDGSITEWHDRKILPGDVWKKEIEDNLDCSDIIILLISQDYIASSSCEDELQYAFKHKECKTIVPIILKPSTWLDTKCGAIQALPKDGNPIVLWPNPEAGWLDVYNGLKQLIQKKKQVKQKTSYLHSIEKVSFVSASQDAVKLSDIFVWPELRCYSIQGVEEVIESKVDTFLSDEKRLSIVKSIELGGKSSLAKKTFIESATMDYFSLLIEGETIFKRVDFDAIARDTFSKQYEGEYSDFQKSPRRLLIIDDYHHRISPSFILWARENFTNILITIDDDEYITYYKDDQIFADFNVYSLKSFNRKKTFDLVTQWKELDTSCNIGTDDFDRQVDDLENKVRTIINKNHIVPSYPFFILSVLQAFDGFMPTDYQITAYGHCYTALITAQLIKKNVHSNDIGDCFNYLTYVAFRMYLTKNNGLSTVSIDDYQLIKEDYKQKYLIKDSLISRIEDGDYPIIDISNTVEFEYPYIYYFFIGKYLAANEDIAMIAELCNSIHKKQSANILIFTIHHATNTTLLDEIQIHCMTTLDGQRPATLSKDETAFMADLIASMPTKLHNKKSIEENRSAERIHQDSFESDRVEGPDADDEHIELIEIQRSHKIIEVLGQIIKNRAGSFDKRKIKELMIEVENLGFRLLSRYLDTLKDPNFAHWIETRISAIENEKFHGKRIMDADSRKIFIQRNIQMMGMLIILGIIHKIFHALSTDKILQVQEEIASEKPHPSYEILTLIFQLNYKGIKLDDIKNYSIKFADSNNSWATQSLTIYVKRYLETHNVDFHVRQKICHLLHIIYTPNRYDNQFLA
jgi:hypothetical protein